MSRENLLRRLPRDSQGNLPLVMEVTAPAALFARPEFKAERLTYPVMPPSAARGVLEAVYWKPEIRYEIAAIEVLSPIRQFTVRRNETHDVAPLKDAAKGIRRVDTVAARDQRNAVCLRDVAYRIHAHIRLERHATKPLAAYRDQLHRRIQRGACFQQPYLGTREFSADFGPPDFTRTPIDVTEELGIMPYHVSYDGRDHQWFLARLERGVLFVRPEDVLVTAGNR